MPDLRAAFARYRAPIGIGVMLLLIALSFASLERLTQEIRFADVGTAVHALSAAQIALALALTAASYCALTFYDVLALQVIGRKLPWRTAAMASFTSYTLSHNLGLALLTGGSARYRIYTAAGLDGPDVGRVVAIASGTFWAGVIAVTGVALASSAGTIETSGLSFDIGVVHIAGAALIALVLLAVIACGVLSRPLRLFGFAMPTPTPRQALLQLVTASVDISFASAALFVLIPGTSVSLLPAFVLAYALGIVAALVTHVPGGIGVFEAIVLAVVPVDRATLFAALIAYRLIYYLLPLAVGVLLLAIHEGARRRATLKLLSRVQLVATGVAPLALSAAAFLGGAMLLLSGSLPSLHGRMHMLALVLPLPFIEASHLAASLVGTGLLLLAPGLYRRLDGAFHGTRALLIAGALFSLAKGVDYEEAVICLGVAALLQWTRRGFYRRTTLTAQPLEITWLVSVAAVVALSVWSGFFAYRHVAYSGDLWWQFALNGDAPRFLRAMLGTAVMLAGACLWRMLLPAAASPRGEVPERDVASIRPILARAVRTEAMLALNGDKRFLVSDAQDCFLMYQVSGSSWIVMGDPVGAPEAWDDLLWRIRDLADRNQGRLLLYEVSPAVLDLAIGMGLNIIKYGEEAAIDLPRFTLDTPRMRSVRRATNTLAKKGAIFRIVPAAAVPVILDELGEVSNEWLATKGQREKGFSLGRFDRASLCDFDVGIVTVEGRIIAFANLWTTELKTEASVDLMRHRADAPPGTMDFLFTHLMAWARDRGYARFSLGMAPLSGIAGRRLAPTWAKTAALIFRHGDRFYGFQGLRAYKEKFDPVWEPRYIAGPHGIGMLQTLRDLARLIARPRDASKPVYRRARPILRASGRRPHHQEVALS